MRLAALMLLLVFGSPALAADELACPAMDVYVRDGCPHCADAKLYLNALQHRYPELIIHYREVSSDPRARQDLLDLSRQHGVDSPGVPSFLICDSLQERQGRWLKLVSGPVIFTLGMLMLAAPEMLI